MDNKGRMKLFCFVNNETPLYILSNTVKLASEAYSSIGFDIGYNIKDNNLPS